MIGKTFILTTQKTILFIFITCRGSTLMCTLYPCIQGKEKLKPI